jgi:hypothetical protein
MISFYFEAKAISGSTTDSEEEGYINYGILFTKIK